MTVSELIEKLRDEDPNAEIVFIRRNALSERRSMRALLEDKSFEVFHEIQVRGKDANYGMWGTRPAIVLDGIPNDCRHP